MTNYPKTIYVWIDSDELGDEFKDSIITLEYELACWNDSLNYYNKNYNIKANMFFIGYSLDCWFDNSYMRTGKIRIGWHNSLEDCLNYRERILQKRIEEATSQLNHKPIVKE